MDAIHTEKYRGYDINIYPDMNCDFMTDDFALDNNLFLVGYHRDFTVEHDSIVTKEEVINLFTSNDEQEEDELKKTKEIYKKYYVFKLEAYIHSGVCLSISYEGNFPDR